MLADIFLFIAIVAMVIAFYLTAVEIIDELIS